MNPITKQLNRLVEAIADEVEVNPAFERRVAAALGLGEPTGHARGDERAPGPRRNRRPPGLFNPFTVYREEGEPRLRRRLSDLTLEQLKDVVAEHGMDSSKLALKWRAPDRLVELIVERVAEQTSKGDAFR